MEFVEYTIGEITKSIRTGTTPTKTNKKFFDGEFLWVTPSDLKGQMVLEETEFTISKLAIDSKKAFLYNKDTVLVSTIGDIGKVSINQIPLASNQQITGIELKPEIILPEVFFYWVKLNKGLLQFKANKAIISILTNKHLKKIKISFPKKLTDQQRIVSNLNSIQLLINHRIRTIEILEQLRRSFFFEIVGDPISNNFNHKWKYLGDKDFFNLSSGVTPLRSFSRFYDGNIPWLKSADVKNNFIATSEEFISELALEKTSAKVYPIDSILIAMYGQGKTKGSVGILKIEASCNQACGVIYPNDFVKPIVLFSQLLYSYDYIRSLGRGANRDNLSLNILKKIKILIPDDDVQNRYEKIFTLTKGIEDQFKKHLLLLQDLFDSYLLSSFEGRLGVKEEEYFEDLIQTLSKEELNQNNRISILIDWIENNKFSDSEKYDVAFKYLLSLLEKGTVEQKSIRGKIKLTVSE